jgi:hypothetical protein
MAFEFLSMGPKGEIPKIIVFGETNLKVFITSLSAIRIWNQAL